MCSHFESGWLAANDLASCGELSHVTGVGLRSSIDYSKGSGGSPGNVMAIPEDVQTMPDPLKINYTYSVKFVVGA